MSDEPEEEEEGAPAWMATFADLATLLLTFFVLLFTFAEMDAKKFALAMGSVQSALGNTPSSEGILESHTSPIESIESLKEPKTEEEKAQLEAALEHIQKEQRKEEVGGQVADIIDEVVEQLELEDDIEVETSSRGVVVQVKDQLFFSAGGATMQMKANPVLDLIADLVESFPGGMAIEGHTDNVPVRGGRYASNWELSTARAYATLEYLKENKGIDPGKLQITGYADTRPIASNDTPEGRSKNRRVEFVFILEDDNAAKPQ